MLFGSLESLHNCVLYPAVAQLYINGSLGDTHLANTLGIHNKSQANQTANQVVTTVKSCLLYYCGGDLECEGYVSNSTFYYGNYTRSIDEMVYPPIYYIEPSIFQFDICRYAAPSSFLNADIGGIGVSKTPLRVGYTEPNSHDSIRCTSLIGFNLALPSLG